MLCTLVQPPGIVVVRLSWPRGTGIIMPPNTTLVVVVVPILAVLFPVYWIVGVVAWRRPVARHLGLVLCYVCGVLSVEIDGGDFCVALL